MPEYNQQIVLSRDYGHSGCHRVKSKSSGKFELNCGGTVDIPLSRI